MKKLLTSLILLSFSYLATAQSIDSDKFEWVWQHNPLIPIPVSVKSYSSNNGFLEIYGQEGKAGGEVILTGAVLPAVQVQHPEITSISGFPVPGYSQVYWVEAKTKDNKIFYYRVFNEFGDLSGRSNTPGQPIQSDMFYFSDLSAQVSHLFAKFKNTYEFKLFYVKKSSSHDDINQAVGYARNAVRMFANDSTEQANQLLGKAVDIWNEALKQSDFEDKNARINKKVTEALYKDLISSLIMLGRFDEAEGLIKKSEAELGLFYEVYIGGQKHFMKKRKLASVSTPVSLIDFEIPADVKLITSATSLSVPGDKTVVQKILPGTWRTVATYTKMPDASEVYKKIEKNDYFHFLPDGSLCFEHEKKNNPFPNNSIDEYFYEVKKTTDGKTCFVSAMSREDLAKKDYDKVFEIIHMSLNSMLIKFENNNPDVDTDFYYCQLERVKSLFKK